MAMRENIASGFARLVSAIVALRNDMLTRTSVYISNTAPDPAIHKNWYTLAGEHYIWDGAYWFQVLGAASSSSGGVTIYTVEVDFGAGALSKTFLVSVASATIGKSVMASVSLDMPAGVAQDELEMDLLGLAAAVQSAGIVKLTVGSVAGITGKRNINLILG